MHQFQVIKQLGIGSFGRVLKVRRKQNQSIFAMKTIKMNQLSAKQKDNALNEVRLLASIDSPNVIKYRGAFFQQNGSVLSILMQFADGGDLAELIQKKTAKNERFQQNFIWRLAFDILKGLKFLHQNNIIHRDIKSANIFFVSGIAKIGDLNVSKVMQGNFATTQTGTPYYTSPQIWEGKKYTVNCDIWSLGCLLYELCCLKPPFMAKDLPGLMKRVVSGYHQPIPSKYSKKLSMLIRKCLTIDHLKRPSANDLLQTDIFELINSPQEGQIQLLDTIRCPRVLKLLNKQLPQNQFSEKKPKNLKIITQETQKSIQNNSNIIYKSLKKIDSQKKIRAILIQRVRVQSSAQRNANQNGPSMNNQINNVIPAHKIPVNGPGGYLKLPKLASYKLIK